MTICIISNHYEKTQQTRTIMMNYIFVYMDKISIYTYLLHILCKYLRTAICTILKLRLFLSTFDDIFLLYEFLILHIHSSKKYVSIITFECLIDTYAQIHFEVIRHLRNTWVTKIIWCNYIKKDKASSK